MKISLSTMEKFAIAAEAIRLGARPPIVRDLVKTLTTDQVSCLYREITGTPPKKGKLPETTSYFVQSNLYRTHSTLLHNIYKQQLANGVAFPYTYINSFKLYLHIVGEDRARLSFDRAWFLIRYMGHDTSLMEMTCPSCGISFVAHITDPQNNPESICPVERIHQLPLDLPVRVAFAA